MAILGAQLVFSLIVFSFLQKLSPYFSFGRWLLCGRLVRYLHPTDDELRKAAGISANGTNKGKGRKSDNKKFQNSQSESFTVPKSTSILLQTEKVEAVDLLQLRFYPDYQWMMDFAVSAFVVYILTEIYYAIGPRTEVNISILWCLLAVSFCLRILFSQTAMYFRLDDGSEKILCVLFGFFFLVVAMGVLVVDDSILEFGLQEGFNNFSDGANMLLKQQGIESHGPVTFLTFKIILAILCAITGSLLTFPGLRYGKLHLDTLRYSKENPLKQVLLHINFILPLVILLLWVRPLGREAICGKHWKARYKLLGEPEFEVLRILLLALMFLIRLCLLPTHMQSHLNLAYEKVESLKKESGRITAVEIQKMIARIFYYLCVVAIQYITPALLLLFMMFMQKTLGDYSWSAILGESYQQYFESFSKSNVSMQNSTLPEVGKDYSKDSISETAAQFSWALVHLRQVFSSLWYRGLFSFLNWWLCAAWFTSTLFGMYYHSNVGSK